MMNYNQDSKTLGRPQHFVGPDDSEYMKESSKPPPYPNDYLNHGPIKMDSKMKENMNEDQGQIQNGQE